MLRKLQTVAMVGCVVLAAGQSGAWAAAPTAEQALKLAPVQEGVDYAKPAAADLAKCTITVKKFAGQVGWVIEDPNGMILRRFVDTNGDNVVDQWSYYKDGIEVYRDIDSDFNQKADQYRWFNTAGGRWGIDKNEDGKVDSWRSISVEEVSAEIVAALAARDADRFALVALKPDDVKGLGLGKELADKLTKKVEPLVKGFRDAAGRQKAVAADSRWLNFSASRPGVVPAGTDGSTQDLRVYENAVAIFETAGKHGQIPIGTLVQVGDTWRAIDLPGEGPAETASAGFFFHGTAPTRTGPAGSGATEEEQKLVDAIQEVDRQLTLTVEPDKRSKLILKRADLVEQVAAQSKTPQDRALWYRQLADMLAGESQSGGLTEGAKRLGDLFEKVKKDGLDQELVAHVRYLQLMADYARALQTNKDFAKVQAQLLKDLEQFVGDYPKAPDTAEAMLQLAMSAEFSGQEEDAGKWYGRVVKEFVGLPAGQKATGAQRRLDSIGKAITVSGKSPAGGAVDSAKFKGKVVLVHYWATWSEPAKQDMATLKELVKKYGSSLAIVGVNLDLSAKDMNSFLSQANVSWPQIWEEGGLDSPPANQLGILTVPTMILIDQQGKVVNRGVQSVELEAELKKLIR
jgi:thiol-disulfide isomerase/thioredoxin